MAGVPKNNEKVSATGEEVARSSQTAQRLASLSSSSRSFGSQSFPKFYRPSGVPSMQSYKARKVMFLVLSSDY